MFQLIQKNNVFGDREERLGKKMVYYVGLLGQFEDEHAIEEEEDIPTVTEVPGLTNMLVTAYLMFS